MNLIRIVEFAKELPIDRCFNVSKYPDDIKEIVCTYDSKDVKFDSFVLVFLAAVF